jgi:hypothetical protein
MKGHVTQSPDARKAMRAAMPFLSVACPKCKAPAGQRCDMELGNFATHHHLRWIAWQEQKQAAS